ncbi:noelin-like [Oculina patagonica]
MKTFSIMLKGQEHMLIKEKHMNYKAQFVFRILGRKTDGKLKASGEKIFKIRKGHFTTVKMKSRYLPLFCCFLALLPGEVLCTSSEGVARTKRDSSSYQMKELALELAKTHVNLLKMIVGEHADLDKAKASVQRDRCTIIKSIGKPVTHNARQVTQGAWMKDPLGIMGSETIFVMEHYTGRNVVEEFENMDMFKAGLPRKTYTLPYNWDGTGAVVYGPHLYYNRVSSGYIVKYNLQTERVEATITVSGYTLRKYNYH